MECTARYTACNCDNGIIPHVPVVQTKLYNSWCRQRQVLVTHIYRLSICTALPDVTTTCTFRLIIH
jgi:hypothetical protein